MVDNKLYEMTIEYIQKNPIYQSLQRTVHQLEQAQEIAYSLATKDESDLLTSLKVGTALTLAVIDKMCLGKNPKDFSKEDWNEIAESVADVVILEDGRTYTERVFVCYANYIDASIRVNSSLFKESHIIDIQALSDEIRFYTESFEKEEITEVDYVDHCLWISFEAMVKLLSAYVTSGLSDEVGNLIVSSVDFSVNYCRLLMYQKESLLLEAYLDHQEKLDAELEEQYESYIKELNASTKEFETLIEDAFSTDFRSRLMNSASLARQVGVNEEKIIDSISKIDDYFN